MPKPIILSEYEKWSEQKEVTAQERKKTGEELGNDDQKIFDKLNTLYGIDHNFSKNKKLEIKANQNIGSVFLPT